jgi:hypothetical protein
MTWSFKPGQNVLEYKRRISTGLEEFGNYHPQVVVREMETIFPDLSWNIYPKTKAKSYTCVLQVRPFGVVYEEEERGSRKMEAKIGPYMKMAERLFRIGYIPPYSPGNMVE